MEEKRKMSEAKTNPSDDGVAPLVAAKERIGRGNRRLCVRLEEESGRIGERNLRFEDRRTLADRGLKGDGPRMKTGEGFQMEMNESFRFLKGDGTSARGKKGTSEVVRCGSRAVERVGGERVRAEGLRLQGGQERVIFATGSSLHTRRTRVRACAYPWYQVGFILTTGINSSYVLGYSRSIMVPLGWIFGTAGLLLAAAISLYANSLVAHLHEVGGRRQIRYRDLTGHVYGRKMYGLTWALQYVNLFMINTGYIILAGKALKALYVLYRDDGILKLPYCIGIAGIICALFAFGIPHLSALRIWLGFSTLFSIVYIIIAFVLSLSDGLNTPARDYSIPQFRSRIFSNIGAIANLVFAYNTGMLPEIQATIKEPAIKNMEKALWFQFTIGCLPLYAVTFMGYWAYGSSTSTYLLSSVQGPVWVKTIANLASFLQTVIALHIFASPMYEYLDTKFGREGNPFSLQNVLFRILVRGGYLTINTLVSALLPFLGDFMSLTGALSTFPLTFVLANHMYLKVKKKKLSAPKKAWHWLNVVVFSCLAVAAAIASLRLIVFDSKTYHIFADL